MYGPVATWFWPYADGFWRSNSAAYSFGTGALSGRARAPASTPPVPRSSLKTIVRSSGVRMPGISVPGRAPGSAPATSPK